MEILIPEDHASLYLSESALGVPCVQFHVVLLCVCGCVRKREIERERERERERKGKETASDKD